MKSIEREQDLFDFLMHNIDYSIFWKDKDGYYRGCNKHFAKLMKLDSPKEIIGKRDSQLNWTAETVNDLKKVDEQMSKKQIDTIKFCSIQQLQSGQKVYTKTTKKLLFNNSQKIIGTISICDDITHLVNRNKKISKKLKLEKDITEITNNFVNIINIDQTIDKTLAQMGDITLADNITIFSFKNHNINMLYEWYSKNSISKKDHIPNLEIDKVHSLKKFLKSKSIHYLTPPEFLKTDFFSDFCVNIKKCKIIVIVPIWKINNLYGFLLSEYYQNDIVNKEDYLSTVKILSSNIEQALIRREEHRELVNSEIRYRNLFIKDPDGILLLDSKDIIKDCNPAAIRILKKPKSKINNKTLQELTSDYEIDLFHSPTNHKSKKSFEKYLKINFAGKYTYIWLMKFPIFNSHNIFNGSVIYIRDITKLKKTESKLRRNEERLKLAIESANEGIWDWDIIHKKLYFNPKAKKILKYDITDKIDINSWEEIINPKDLQKSKNLIDRNLENKIPFFEIEMRVKTKFGRWLWISNKGQVVKRDENNKPIRATGTITDITRRKQAERALISSKNFLQNIFASFQDGILILNKTLKVVKSNVIMKSWFPEKLPFNKKNYSEILPDNPTSIKSEKKLKQVLKNKSHKKWETSIYKNNKNIWYEVYSFPIINKNEKVQGIVQHIRDITSKKNIENQLRQAQKLESIGQLAAGIAHEINTPTQYVGDNTRFFQESFEDISQLIEKIKKVTNDFSEDCLSKEQFKEIEKLYQELDIDFLLEEIPEAIDQTLDGLKRITKIVRAMKDFSHPGVSDKTSININQAIESTITVAKNEWKYVAEVKTELSDNLPNISCYVDEINQAILNLIVNAAHAIEDVVKDSTLKGKIEIKTFREQNYVVIEISDTGKGIPDSNKNKIFDPFFTTKEVGKGTGQGLSVVYSVIVEKHNGKIDFQSKLGKGTTFTLKLPITSNE
mgnify:CR=1 FL=1